MVSLQKIIWLVVKKLKISVKQLPYLTVSHTHGTLKAVFLDQVSTLKATSSNALYKRDAYAAWGAPEIVKAKKRIV